MIKDLFFVGGWSHTVVAPKAPLKVGPLGIHFLKKKIITKKGNLHCGHYRDRYLLGFNFRFRVT